MHRLRSDAKKTVRRASSSGSQTRCNGVEAEMAANCSAPMTARISSVNVVPGAMAFTRMPWGPSSAASVIVRWLMPALAAP